jgi:hypothetical protein
VKWQVPRMVDRIGGSGSVNSGCGFSLSAFSQAWQALGGDMMEGVRSCVPPPKRLREGLGRLERVLHFDRYSQI